MEDENKVVFEEYDIEFNKEDFDNLSSEELKQCKEIIKEIEKEIK